MVSFIILHYKNIKDTIECIESIKKLNNQEKISIIVVDNNSGNKSDIKKLKKYTDDVLVMEENLGFAKGNNAGCEYAIKKYNPDFLAVINNDTIIEQKDFIIRIEESYKKYKFDCLGPKINTDNGESVNPFPAYKTLEEVNNAISYSNKLIKIYNSKILRNTLKVYMGIKRMFIKPRHLENGKTFEKNVSLHGCSMIFAKKYYKKYDDVFYKETFLYHEEEFLEYRRRKDNLLFVYDPSLEIFHKEGSSLNTRFTEDVYKKMIFREKEIIKSLTLLKNVMEKNRRI